VSFDDDDDAMILPTMEDDGVVANTSDDTSHTIIDLQSTTRMMDFDDNFVSDFNIKMYKMIVLHGIVIVTVMVQL
jgi:hypothetical protein